MNFEFIAGNLALDFANTVHSFGARDPEDDLKTNQDLIAWGVQAGVIKEYEFRRLVNRTGDDKEVLRRARELRKILYYLFARIAIAGSPEQISLNYFARLVREAMGRATFRYSQGKVVLQCEEKAAPLERLHFAVIRSAMELLTSDQLARVRECAGNNCSWMFLDTSRNGKRRWCDMEACGNREKARRFRKRAA